jgi:hypothetical protein
MIAHEIKNPLTPSGWRSSTCARSGRGDPQLRPRARGVRGPRPEQTDELRLAASEFSGYARMPRRRSGRWGRRLLSGSRRSLQDAGVTWSLDIEPGLARRRRAPSQPGVSTLLDASRRSAARRTSAFRPGAGLQARRRGRGHRPGGSEEPPRLFDPALGQERRRGSSPSPRRSWKNTAERSRRKSRERRVPCALRPAAEKPVPAPRRNASARFWLARGGSLRLFSFGRVLEHPVVRPSGNGLWFANRFASEADSGGPSPSPQVVSWILVPSARVGAATDAELSSVSRPPPPHFGPAVSAVIEAGRDATPSSRAATRTPGNRWRRLWACRRAVRPGQSIGRCPAFTSISP